MMDALHTELTHERAEEHREFRSYVWGIVLALTLTVLPFALVHWHLVDRLPLLITIGVCALVQMGVHLGCFLHIRFKRHRDDLQLLLFSALLLAIMVGGTLWIMASLALRMALPAQP